MRAAVRWLWLPVLLAFAWAGWVVWSRKAGNAEIERAAEAKQARADAEIVEKMGGRELKVLSFYANPGIVGRGEAGLLCYGVANAASVAIEPGVTGIAPSLSRCVEIRPARDTDYTLRAWDSKGTEVVQTVSVTVR
ncbi:MAG: hypothetical protein SGI92_19910 [Bryobacteraceae bacterium]|nr:hypothetical protein [Bryobacteraceae bacterium]